MVDLTNTRRIGALVPATNPVVEPDFYRVVPPEITVHFERMWNGAWGSQPDTSTESGNGESGNGESGNGESGNGESGNGESGNGESGNGESGNGESGNGESGNGESGHRLSMSSAEANEIEWALFGFDVGKMNDDVARGASALSNIGPDVLVYACTSGTWHKGYMAYDRSMAKLMEDASGVESITAVGSCIAAMRHMGSRKLSIAGPYRNYHLRNRLKPLMEEAGFEVLSADGAPWMENSMNPREIDMDPPQAIIDFAAEVAQDDADTIFLPGTAWRALDAAEELEQRLGKTVITVNQATIWMALRRLGWAKPIDGFGSLLRSLE